MRIGRVKLVLVGRAVFVASGLVSIQSNAVTWDVQAERLQKVSASLLDAQPLLSSTGDESHKGRFRIEGKAVVSVLPKMNATVGGKTEQPPQPPAHSIPTLEADYDTASSSVGSGAFRLWAGMLPESAAKSTGMKASCGQTISGFTLGYRLPSTAQVIAIFEIGQQWNSTSVKGGITEPEAEDTFDVKTKLRFGALTLSPKQFENVWFQLQVAERSVATHFEIPADGTSFDLKDESRISNSNAATQITMGYRMGGNLQAAVAYLNVPQRVSMPRFLLSYSMSTSSFKDNVVAYK